MMPKSGMTGNLMTSLCMVLHKAPIFYVVLQKDKKLGYNIQCMFVHKHAYTCLWLYVKAVAHTVSYISCYSKEFLYLNNREIKQFKGTEQENCLL